MHYGELRMFDETKKVVKEYKEFVDWFNKLSKKEKQKYQLEHKEGRKGVQKTEKVTRYKESGKRRSFFGPAFQVTIIAVLTILLALSMFSDRPLRTLATFGAIPSDQTGTSHTKNPQTKGSPDMKKVDRQAIVTSDPLTVYKDQAMKKRRMSLYHLGKRYKLSLKINKPFKSKKHQRRILSNLMGFNMQRN